LNRHYPITICSIATHRLFLSQRWFARLLITRPRVDALLRPVIIAANNLLSLGSARAAVRVPASTAEDRAFLIRVETGDHNSAGLLKA
ncbi:MAG TPA: hypothetical protein VNB49_13260, partial [Candidatus Dormibacteraeota bacterium]|nr:hypothetical protein [Candidatus Dormibacteraeota bacterium]